MQVTHVVLVKYINDVALEVAVCFYATSEEKARGLARTISSKTPRTILMPGERPPHIGSLVECTVVGEVSWAPL